MTEASDSLVALDIFSTTGATSEVAGIASAKVVGVTLATPVGVVSAGLGLPLLTSRSCKVSMVKSGRGRGLTGIPRHDGDLKIEIGLVNLGKVSGITTCDVMGEPGDVTRRGSLKRAQDVAASW